MLMGTFQRWPHPVIRHLDDEMTLILNNCKVPEVGNTADTPNPLGIYPY